MKSKFFKVVGVIVAMATVASMLVTSAVPTSAAVGTLAWGVVDTPSNVGRVLMINVDVDLVAAAADGKTVFAFDDTANNLYKSTNAGATWGAPVVIAAGAAVDLVVSPNFATDGIVALADAGTVFASTNGGATFTALAVGNLEGGAVTSLDIGNYYADNVVNFLVGIAGGAGAFSNVQRFPVSGLGAWTGVGTITLAGVSLQDPDGAGALVPAGALVDLPVIDVKFSQSHVTDGEIMAVYTDATNTRTWLSSKFGAVEWNLFILPVSVVNTALLAAPTSAKIAGASDYVANTGGAILVGLNGGGLDDIYRITGRSLAAGASADLNVSGAGSNTSIRQLAVSGPSATAGVLFSVPASGTLRRAAGVSTFTLGTISKQPTGPGNAWPVWGGTVAFVGTTGADSAVSRSIDSGATFDQVGLIDVGAAAPAAPADSLNDLTLGEVTVVDANTMFLVMISAEGGAYAARHVYKTTDGGVSWVRILTGATTVEVVASPAYATDATIIVIDGTTTVLKSTNGGASFIPLVFMTGASKALVVDTNNFFGGGVTAAAFFKAGRFTGATGVAGTVFSIALNPKDATKATLAIGNTAGAVYQSTNDGVSFAIVGTAPAAANVTVAYAPDGTLYAADSAGGVFRWTGAAWLPIQAATATDLVLTADGTLYSPSNAAGVGVWRSLKPTAATALAAEFQALTYAAALYPAAGVIIDLQAISTATDNTAYIVENTTDPSPAAVDGLNTFQYVGRIYGFKDTLVTATAVTAPAAGALLTTTTTAALSWPAVTGATAYAYVFDGAAEVATAAATPTSVTVAGLTGGTAHTWSARVTAPLFNRTSVARTFTTALPAVAAPIALELPKLGAVDAAIDGTFTWPSVVGATGYEFVIAEDLGETDKFAIIDYSATTATNAHKLRENLKYNTTYYWRVRAFNATTKGDWTVYFFTTMKKPVPPPEPLPPVIITTMPAPPAPQITLEIPPDTTPPVQVIPDYLLWAVIAVGAVLVIAVIILIVRTRRIS